MWSVSVILTISLVGLLCESVHGLPHGVLSACYESPGLDRLDGWSLSLLIVFEQSGLRIECELVPCRCVNGEGIFIP